MPRHVLSKRHLDIELRVTKLHYVYPQHPGSTIGRRLCVVREPDDALVAGLWLLSSDSYRWMSDQLSLLYTTTHAHAVSELHEDPR